MAGAVVLGFDTSGPYCSAALLVGGDVVAAAHEAMPRGQAERLMPLLQEVMDQAGLGWQDLDRIGVGIGPGNFTGIRISVSAARGLSLGLKVPALGVSLLDALAVDAPGPVLTCLTAPRGAAFVQSNGMETRVDPTQIQIDDIPSGWAEPGLTCIGSAADDIASHLGATTAPSAFAPGSAVARIAAQGPVTPDARPTPLYLRPADAAPPKNPAPAILP